MNASKELTMKIEALDPFPNLSIDFLEHVQNG